MPPVPPDTILAQLRWRYATKKFDPTRKIAAEVWAKLEAGDGARAVVVRVAAVEVHRGHRPRDAEEAAPGVVQPGARFSMRRTSSSSPRRTRRRRPTSSGTSLARPRSAGSRSRLSIGLKQTINGSLARMSAADAHAWAARQTYLALGFFLSACALAGVDACPMEGFQPEKYDEILGLKEKGLSAVVLATAGYRLAG